MENYPSMIKTCSIEEILIGVINFDGRADLSNNP